MGEGKEKTSGERWWREKFCTDTRQCWALTLFSRPVGGRGRKEMKETFSSGLREAKATAICFGSKGTPRDTEWRRAMSLCSVQQSPSLSIRRAGSVTPCWPLQLWRHGNSTLGKFMGLFPGVSLRTHGSPSQSPGHWWDLSGAGRPASCRWRQEPVKVWIYLFVSLGWCSQPSETWRHSR